MTRNQKWHRKIQDYKIVYKYTWRIRYQRCYFETGIIILKKAQVYVGIFSLHFMIVTCGRSMVFFGYSGFLHQLKWTAKILVIVVLSIYNPNRSLFRRFTIYFRLLSFFNDSTPATQKRLFVTGYIFFLNNKQNHRI